MYIIIIINTAKHHQKFTPKTDKTTHKKDFLHELY